MIRLNALKVDVGITDAEKGEQSRPLRIAWIMGMSIAAGRSAALAAAATYALLVLGQAEALAQGRKGVRLTQPREPARYLASPLRYYSLGLGTLERAAAGPDAGILRSTITDVRWFSVTRLRRNPGRPDPPAPRPLRRRIGRWSRRRLERPKLGLDFDAHLPFEPHEMASMINAMDK